MVPAPEKLKVFDGKIIGIEIRGLGSKLYLAVRDTRIDVVRDIDKEPDTTISGSPAGLFKLGLHRDSAPLFFGGEVEIRGDTRLGRQFKAVLAEMEIDWEEHLSRFTGDVAAHRIVTALKDVGRWSKTAASNLNDDIGETRNLAEELPEITQDLHGMMLRWRDAVNAPVPVEPNPDYNPIVR